MEALSKATEELNKKSKQQQQSQSHNTNVDGMSTTSELDATQQPSLSFSQDEGAVQTNVIVPATLLRFQKEETERQSELQGKVRCICKLRPSLFVVRSNFVTLC